MTTLQHDVAGDADPLWSDVERDAWRPEEQLRPSRFAERHRVLTRRQSSRPGPWLNDNAPPLAVIMDLCVRRTVRELWVMKAGQVGVSEAIRNVIMSWAAREPDPVLIVLPNEKDGRKIIRKRVIPLFEDTPILAELSTGKLRDKKLTSITLVNGFDLQLGWSGSASSLASDPIRRVILDETDKFEDSAGREAAPVDLARTRTRSYGDRGFLVALSTPTIASGPMAMGFDECSIQLNYYVPCPHCGTFQRLTFDRLRWEKFTDLPELKARAARIKARHATWYECAAPSCGKRILEEHKRQIVALGYFATDDGSWKLFPDGREQGRQPEGDKVGVHYPALYDYQTPCWDVAAEFVAAGTDPLKLQHLYNSTLGEPFRHQVAAATVSVFAAKCKPDPERGFTPAPAKVLPTWVSRLLMTVDTQKTHFWYVIRGWGAGFRSIRIHHGRATSFEELRELFYRAYFPSEGQIYPALRCYQLGIDSGGWKRDAGHGEDADVDATLTDQVYQFCLKDPLWLLPLKGIGKPFDERVRKRHVTYTPPNRSRDPYSVWLHQFDAGYFNDLLAGSITGSVPIVDTGTGELTDAPQWALNDVNDEEYNRHLANMHKVRVRRGAGTARGYVERWVPKTAGARVDYRACEVEQLVMAHGPGQCYALPSAEMIAKQHAPKPPPKEPGGVKTPDGRPFFATQRK